ncbi:MAG TPA: GNAT family N-acetyltransferase [Nevskiaceae bacterium]|nr:GNAT family N-acetyltransferase [Nevskiaceae bacterium]
MAPETRAVTTWHLEQTDPAQLRRARVPEPAPMVMQAREPLPELNRFLYSAVGGDWHWIDRLSWSHARWLEYLSRPQVQTWVLYVDGTPAGYVELEQQEQGNVELAYFGLIGKFIGRGLGGHLLTRGIEQAWAMPGTRRVWVHTCTLDGEHALANYQARGMRLYHTDTSEKRVGATPGPWPGAR